MKKCLSGLLALVLMMSLCTGCGQTKEPPSGIYYDITGIDPRDTAYRVGDVEFPVEMYLYWMAYSCSSLEYNLNMYYMYAGAYSEMFSEEGELLWDAVFMDGLTLSEYAKQQAQDNLLFYAAIENKAKELGLELTEEDQAALEANFAETLESMGGQEAFDENLEMMGITRESFDRIAGDARLFQNMVDMVLEEDSALYLAPEEYESLASYTDHILLSTQNQDGEALSEEEAAQKYATAQELLDQLQAAGDVETLFDQLADQYSEDPGRAAEKGYLVTEESNFVEEFLTAALELSPGEVSDIVESTYGYHILYRRELTEEQRNSLAEEYLYTQLDNEMAQLTLEGSDGIEAIDAGQFYTDYNAKIEEITAAREDSASGTDGTDSPGTDGGALADDGTPDSESGTGESGGNGEE